MVGVPPGANGTRPRVIVAVTPRSSSSVTTAVSSTPASRCGSTKSDPANACTSTVRSPVRWCAASAQ
ncbi:Uncharacterised protein [Mycobacteroides abscessus]|nr:Uncharacterised protein [Mycobacteroides abscessus]